MPKSSSLAIAVLAKEWVGMAFPSEILSESLSFSSVFLVIAIAKKPLFGITISKASVNSTIDNIQFPLFFGITNANAIAQCERTLKVQFILSS